MNWKVLLATALLIAGCSQTQEKAGIEHVQQDQERLLSEFERGNKLLDEKRYDEAAKVYDALLTASPTSQLDVLILFNSGLAHLQNEDCATAGERFRKVIRMTAKKSPAVQARAQLRMSDVYTCLGEDNKAITNLVEIFIAKSVLPIEIGQAEIPAKLAAAYARNGNNKQAEKYFRIAEKGLLQLQTEMQNSTDRREILTKTLFMMGSIDQINTETMSADDYLTTIKALQKYLYKAVEMDERSWSPQAVEQIERAYAGAWSYIERATVVDADGSMGADAGQREQAIKREQVRLAQQTLQALKALYMERIADPQEPLIVSQLMKKMKTQENKIRNYIATNISGTALTPEALEAEGLRRAGRVLNPDPILEKQATKKNKSGNAKGNE